MYKFNDINKQTSTALKLWNGLKGRDKLLISDGGGLVACNVVTGIAYYRHLTHRVDTGLYKVRAGILIKERPPSEEAKKVFDSVAGYGTSKGELIAGGDFNEIIISLVMRGYNVDYCAIAKLLVTAYSCKSCKILKDGIVFNLEFNDYLFIKRTV